MHDLGVELHGVEPAAHILHGGYGAALGPAAYPEAERYLIYIIGMAHPAGGMRRHVAEQLARAVDREAYLAVFAVAGFDLAAQHECHELSAVADAQHRYAELKQLL